MGNLLETQQQTHTCDNVVTPQQPPQANNEQNYVQNPQQSQTPHQQSGFEQKILDLHNKVRVKNNLEPLVWNKALQQKAADWNLFMQQQGGGDIVCRKMRHPGTGTDGSEEEIGRFLPNNNGQNLYQSNGAQLVEGQYIPFDSSSPEDAVRQWYDECRIWKKPEIGRDVPERFLEIGHLTQILWRDAKEIGCSAVPCSDTNLAGGKPVQSKGQIITCHYDRGNVSGQFQTQIPDNIYCDNGGNWWVTQK